MLMSKSRLEKFLYALYSLDSSDLPTPLSRIEELYKCWVTGEEVPTFEPISRTEKYLMAILGGYDVNSLPNPLSRVEVLLYKLATGDDDLDDVKSFLSEHEELLAEIIRNGGVGGDIEYVLYTLSTEHSTLYNTSEKPVKNAILKGNTLVNLINEDKQSNYHINLSGGSSIFWIESNAFLIKPSTKYLVISNVSINTGLKLIINNNETSISCFTDSIVYDSNVVGVKKLILISKSDLTKCTTILRSYAYGDGEVKGTIQVIEYQDGMENWDIPYFEGIKSVQMPVLTTSNEDGTKTNILTVNEEVELRGIGEVKDELNVLTGELTQRIETRVYQEGDESNSDVITDLTNTVYKLTTESVKTVDLSVIDQDGNNTKLSTFNDITHVTLSSEGLIPEAELEVATKNEEVVDILKDVLEVEELPEELL